MYFETHTHTLTKQNVHYPIIKCNCVAKVVLIEKGFNKHSMCLTEPGIPNTLVVGGFNPFEKKSSSNWIMFPNFAPWT